MAIAGYQDWQRYSVPSSDNVVSEIVPAANVHNGPVTDCSQWSYVQLTMANFDPAIHFGANINWLGYNGTVQNTQPDFLTIGPNTLLSFVRPVRGRTLQIGYASLDGTPTQHMGYGVIGMSHYVSKYDLRSPDAYLIRDSSVYAANSSKVLSSLVWYEGDVQVSLASSGGTSAVASFQYYDQTALAYQEFASVGILSQSTAMPLRLSFPPAPVQVQVFNLGAGQTINTEVIFAESR